MAEITTLTVAQRLATRLRDAGVTMTDEQAEAFAEAFSGDLTEWTGGPEAVPVAFATKFTTLGVNWNTAIMQELDWSAGTVDGGPEGDGRYPKTNAAGVTELVPCIAKIMDSTAKGNPGWTAKTVIEPDGPTRAVLRILDWTGGAGVKPGTGYVAADGSLVETAAAAYDMFGALSTTLTDLKTASETARTGAETAKGATQTLFDTAGDILPRRLPLEAGTWLYRWRTASKRLLGGFMSDGSFAPVKFRAPTASIDLTALASAVSARLLSSSQLTGMLGAMRPEQGGGFRVRVGNRLLATFDQTSGFYPRRAKLPAATKLDDKPTVNLVDRVLGGAIGAYFKAGLVEATAGFRLRFGNRLLLTVDQTDGLYPRRAKLPADTKIADQPTVRLADRLAPANISARENAGYVVLPFKDGSGKWQIGSRRKSDGLWTVLTSGGNNVDPVLAADDIVFYWSEAAGAAMYVPVGGGTAWPIEATSDFVGWGDSMTEASSGYGPTFSALYPARNFYNQGIGGQNTEKTATRMGALPWTMTISGGVIPTSGSVTVTPNIDLLQPPAVKNMAIRVKVLGVECNLARTPGAATSDPGTYALTPLVYPGAPIAAAGDVPATITSGYLPSTLLATSAPTIETLWKATTIIRTGKNDTDRAGYDQAQMVSRIGLMVGLLKPRAKRLIVCGITNGTANLPTSMGGSQPDEPSSQASLQRIADANTAIAAALPGFYADPLAYHVAHGGSGNYTVNGQVFAVLNSTVLVDGVHENSTGKANTAALFQSIVTAKGF